jgi:hypothetical protein
MRHQAGWTKRIATNQSRDAALLAKAVRDAPDLMRPLAGERFALCPQPVNEKHCGRLALLGRGRLDVREQTADLIGGGHGRMDQNCSAVSRVTSSR